MAEELKNDNTASETAEEVAAASDTTAEPAEESTETAAETAEETSETAAPETSETTSEAETADAAAAKDSKDGKEVKEKKGFFKKKKDKKDEQIEELNDKYLRSIAEFNNFRNRTEKEKAARFDMGAKSVIEKMLPIVDSFERGLASIPEDKKEDAFVVGMDKVYKQLTAQLEAMDVKPIEAVGKEFNPEFHNAVMQVATEEYESGVVAQEFQKGYTYKDSVVRHSMVAVAQ